MGINCRSREGRAGCREAVGASSRFAAPSLCCGPPPSVTGRSSRGGFWSSAVAPHRSLRRLAYPLCARARCVIWASAGSWWASGPPLRPSGVWQRRAACPPADARRLPDRAHEKDPRSRICPSPGSRFRPWSARWPPTSCLVQNDSRVPIFAACSSALRRSANEAGGVHHREPRPDDGTPVGTAPFRSASSSSVCR